MIWLDACPACGAQDQTELVNRVEELEQENGRLSNHVMATDRTNEDLKKALNLWAESFYCDGETSEKAAVKELRFNEFVELTQEMGIGGHAARRNLNT